MRDKSTDPRVIAIREDNLVGFGSCSSIDECWSNQMLIEALDSGQITDPKKAVQWARKLEGLHLEQGLNQRWGEDDDPQLTEWKNWQKRLKEKK